MHSYVCLCKNRYYHVIYTCRRTMLMVCAVWAIAIALMLPNYFSWGGHTFDMKVVACVFHRSTSYSHTVFLVMVSSAPPILCIVICYVRIYRHVMASQRSLCDFGSVGDTAQRASFRKQEVRLAKSLLVIFAVFVVCWSPLAVIFVFDIDNRFPKVAYVLATQLAHASSAINSVVYAATNAAFRDGYRYLVCYFCKTRARRNRRKSISWTRPRTRNNSRALSSSMGSRSPAATDENKGIRSNTDKCEVELSQQEHVDAAIQSRTCLVTSSALL